MPKKPSKPHDEFFKAAFGRLEIALDYISKMLPAGLVQELELSNLIKVNGSYISPALRETFSDLVFECPFKSGDLLLSICLLFEHKKQVEAHPHFQLLRYLLDTWEEQLKQKKALTPIIPIVIYQGKRKWKIRDMSEYFATPLPDSLLQFLPRFDYHFTHVSAMSDEAILGLGRSLLVNAFLMMKYIDEPDFIVGNPGLIFIELEEPNSPRDFIVALLAYFLKNTELAKEKVQNFIEILPKTLTKTAMSTYDMILAEGVEQGKQQQRLLLEEALRREEEERQRALEAMQREEEERQRLDGLILYLYETAQLPIEQIASLSNRDIQYIEALIHRREE